MSKDVERTGDLIGNKIADRNTKVLKTSPQSNWETITNRYSRRKTEIYWWSKTNIIA